MNAELKNITYSKIFLLLSSLAKNLLGTFNCIYLYKHGFSVIEVAIWVLITYIGYMFFQPILLKYSYKFSNKLLLVISTIFFVSSYIELVFYLDSLSSLILNAILYTCYASIYWNVRHDLEFTTLNDKKIGRKVGILLIISQISEITAAIISALILDNFSIVPLVVTSSILMLVSLISVFLIKETRKKKYKGSIITYFKIVPKVTLFHLFLREASTVMSEFFSLYLFIYVSNTYSFAGLANFFLGLASIIFTYFLSKRIDDKRESYLLLCTILICLIYLFKINITTEAVLIIIFIEGFIKQFFNVVNNNNYYILGTNIDKKTYICGNEFFINIARIVITLVGLFLTGSLPKLMYFCIGLLVLSGFVPFEIKTKGGKNNG